MAPGKHRPVIYCNDSVNVTSYTVIRVIAINVLTLPQYPEALLAVILTFTKPPKLKTKSVKVMVW